MKNPFLSKGTRRFRGDNVASFHTVKGKWPRKGWRSQLRLWYARGAGWKGDTTAFQPLWGIRGTSVPLEP